MRLRTISLSATLAMVLAATLSAQEPSRMPPESLSLTASSNETPDQKGLEAFRALQRRWAPDPAVPGEPAPSTDQRTALKIPPLRGQEADVALAVEEYLATGDAATIKRSATVLFPFGESQPVVRCSPLRACDIELEAGEIVTGVALGASELWITSPLLSGSPQNPVPHVIVKPKAYDLATNLVIGTTRRTYHVGLISPPRSQVTDGDVAYHRHVSFYYPSELVQEWARLEELEAQGERRRRGTVEAELGALSVEDLNFAYTTRAEKKAPWKPTLVFDDGHHVYLRLPSAVRSGDLPALLVEADDGRLAVTNYRVQGRWYIVDGLFRRARLVVGTGKKQRKVEITNHRSSGAGEAR